MNQLLTDLRSGVRMLVKYPTLSIVAVLTLGLGIGLSTTVFCVVNGGLFKGLPFPTPTASWRWSAPTRQQNQPQTADQRSGPGDLDGAADLVRQVRRVRASQR